MTPPSKPTSGHPTTAPATPTTRSVHLRWWLPGILLGMGLLMFSSLLLLQQTQAWADRELQILFFVGTCTLGSIGVLLLGQRYVLRPIAHLQRSIAAIGAGQGQDQPQHPPALLLHGQGELMDLAQAIQDMAQDLQASQAAQAASQAHFRRLAEAMQEAILLTEHGRITDANAAAERLLQLPQDSTLLDTSILTWVAPDFHAAVRERIHLGLEGTWVVDFVTTQGNPIACEVRVHEVMLEGKATRVVCVRDIRERLQAEATIRQLVHFDALTGLPNRRLLLDLLAAEVKGSRGPGHRAALATLNLDNFKSINDSLGMASGDTVLRLIAQRLSIHLQQGETLARVDGDTLALLVTGLHGTGESASGQAATKVERLLQLIAQPLEHQGHILHLSAGAGVTLLPNDSQEPAELLRQAETAMHQSKQAADSRVRFFANSLQQAANARLALRNDLHQALAQPAQHFQLHYQPQLNAQGQMLRVEALVRWQHPQRGLVAPAAFIPEAEASGLIIPLGRWVLQEACTALLRWREQAHSAPWAARLGVAVNVSTRQFREPDFVQQVLDTLAQLSLPPESLELELTESVLIQDLESTLEKMGQLRQHGIRLALDDFGTGYSSLSYLKRLPIDTLKIDRSFIWNIDSEDPSTNNDPGPQTQPQTQGKRPAVLIDAIIDMAHQLDIAVLAEGVETQAQLTHLQQADCDMYQGYFFSRPLPESQLHAWATDQAAQRMLC